MTRHTLVIALLLACVAATPTTRNSRIAIAKALWEQRLAKANGEPIKGEYYPTEDALVFLSAYDVMRDKRFARQAAIQLEYSHSREINSVFITSEKVTTRDYQARQIYNFYLAYRILGDGRYLRWADDCAAAMIRAIPREPHECAGETHKLFIAGFFTPDGKAAHDNGNVIDVNQNAEVGLAYSLLYHDPASKFFLDPLAKQIAYDELLASMSIQNMTSGEIPLHENILVPDTLYGSYAAFSWTWAQLLWHDAKFEPHLRAAGKWLGPMTNLSRDSQRWYPKHIENGQVSESEAAFRVPLLWYCDIDATKLLDQLLDGDVDERKAASLYWAYYDLMGIGRGYYINGERGPGVRP